MMGASDARAAYTTSFLADPTELLRVRRALTGWAMTTPIERQRVADLILAANEAVTNCIEHAYPPDRPGLIDVHATVQNHRLQLMVRDYGRWRDRGPEPAQREPWRGRGLSMIRALADDTDLVRDDSGTTVTTGWSLPGASIRASDRAIEADRPHRSGDN